MWLTNETKKGTFKILTSKTDFLLLTFCFQSIFFFQKTYRLPWKAVRPITVTTLSLRGVFRWV